MTSKREFVTTWTTEELHLIRGRKVQFMPEEFFDKRYTADGTDSQAILPSDIKFVDLLPFIGKKTRVTIEVLEW